MKRAVCSTYGSLAGEVAQLVATLDDIEVKAGLASLQNGYPTGSGWWSFIARSKLMVGAVHRLLARLQITDLVVGSYVVVGRHLQPVDRSSLSTCRRRSLGHIRRKRGGTSNGTLMKKSDCGPDTSRSAAFAVMRSSEWRQETRGIILDNKGLPGEFRLETNRWDPASDKKPTPCVSWFTGRGGNEI